MTWKNFPNRGETLRAVIATANARRDGLLPMDVEGVTETFADELTLLGALQLTWHTRLNGHIDRQQMAEPMDLDAAVIAAWCSVAAELPGVREIIDHYRDEPLDEAMAAAMARATQKEHAYLATMAGLASVHDMSGAPLGAALEERARELRDVVPLISIDESPRPSLIERLKAVIAA